MLKNEIIEMSERLERMDAVLLEVKDFMISFKQQQTYPSPYSFSPQKSQNDKNSSLFYSAHEDPVDSSEERRLQRSNTFF